MGSLTTKKYSFADFELDGPRRRLFRNGEAVALKSRTFDLLLALVEKQGEILSKDELLETVWAGQFVEEGNLTVHISALRKVLGEKKDDHRFIVTVPGRGYSFIAEFNDSPDEFVIESHSLEQIVVEEEITDDDEPPVAARLLPGRGWRDHKWLMLTTGVIALVLFGLGGYFLLHKMVAKNTGPSQQQMIVKRLTNKGNLSRAALSPDGKLFAFSVPEGENESLWLGHVDGGEPVQIRPPSSQLYINLKFTPDASSLYYTLAENFSKGTLYRMPVFGGTPEKINADFRTFTFDPDGKHVTFIRYDSTRDRGVIYSADMDGADEHELAALPNDQGSNWGSPHWSPDKKTLVLPLGVGVGQSRMFRVNNSDGSTTALTPKIWGTLDALSWVHDGSGIIATGMDEGSDLRQMWFVDFPGGEVRRLTNDLADWGFVLSLSNDDSALVVQGISQSNIWTAPANDLHDSKQVTFGSIGRMDGWNGLEWTSDGHIIYAANSKDGSTLSIMNADGSKQRQLIPGGGDNSYPSLTADGRYVYFLSNRDGHFGAWRSDIDGGNLTQLTGAQTVGQPFVSPDGKWLIYNSSVDSLGKLWRMPAAGGDSVEVTDKPAGWAQISPDSKFIACEVSIEEKARLAVLSLETGELIRSFELPRLANLRLGVHWTPDGRSLTYRDWTNGIWKQEIEGGEPKRLEGLPGEKFFCYGWSPDGRSFAFTRGTTTRDAVLVTGIGGS